jgi:transcriptional regulator with XRE-family HTH domain
MVNIAIFQQAVHQEKTGRIAMEDAQAKIAIGRRLAEETSRLDLTSTRAAQHAACSRRTWRYYESGETTPDAAMLLRLDALGFDILYVVTGRKANTKRKRMIGSITR